jgi:glycosyltransferase involved in cell wall biosynthesis
MPNNTSRRIALVAPWFGRELIGGAERLAWELAHALARTGATVEVLTTCCRSFHDDWGANYHRAGTTVSDGVTVRRFKVDSRDRAAFGRANAAVTTLPRISLRTDRSPLDEHAARAFFSENILSKGLLEYLRAAGADFDAVLFVPYLYGTTIAGVPIVADRAFAIPCLHDEPYAYLSAPREMFAAVRGVLFNSEGEAEVAGKIYGPAIYAKSRVIGHAVDPIDPPRTPLAIGSYAPHRSRYVLYLGRQDHSKNVDFLVEAFARFRERRIATSLQLVLAGPRSGNARSTDGIVYLGPVDEPQKAALLTYARAVAQPSVNESFSRTIYESWYAARPVLVHGDCRATAQAVEVCGGGWIATSIDDWIRVFSTIDESSDDALSTLGRRGWAAAVESGSWDTVALRALGAIDAILGNAAAGVQVDQILPLGDRRVATYAGELDRALRARGADVSMVIAGSSTQREGAWTIVHAADAEPAPVAADLIVAHAGDAYLPEAAPPVFAANVNALQTLVERGINARLVPDLVDPGVWSTMRPDGNPYDDGLLTIFSIAPLTQPDAQRLIEIVVALVGIAGNVRLLIDTEDCDADARATLERERDDLDLADAVTLLAPGPAGRYAALRAAHVAVALGMPMTSVRAAVDPLWFDVPVIAFDDPITREAIEPCGFIVDARPPLEIAALIKIVATDAALRNAAFVEGRRVRARHAPETISAAFLDAQHASAGRKNVRNRDINTLS